jgi:hypothetical protein
MTTLIVLASVLGYLVVGAVYARSRTVSLYQRAKEQWRYKDMTMESVRWMIAWRVAFWWFAIPLDVVRGPISRWFSNPITDRQQRAQQLREDARAWDAKRHTGTPAEQAMAAELADMCRARATEIDL